jgi:hypothetical protein
LSLHDIERYAAILQIPHFRGVFMRELLPDKPCDIECGVLNLGDIDSSGTHWTCYVKNGTNKLYFDSFGDANPPLELISYLGKDRLVYNTDRIQEFDDDPICGHLCLEVLRRHEEDWASVISILRNDKYVWRSWFPL